MELGIEWVELGIALERVGGARYSAGEGGWS